MNKNPQLIQGFNAKDGQKVKVHLTKLLPFIDTTQLVIVGGLAIRYLLKTRGIKYPIGSFNDLDLMVKKASAVSPEVQKKFLVYHYHPPKENSFYIVLIDPQSKTKVDIFDWNPPAEETIEVKFDGQNLLMRSIEDQLVKTVFDIQRISPKNKVDPKQFQDTKLLSKIADFKKAEEIWEKRNFIGYPDSIEKAIERAERIAQEHPDWLKIHPFKKPKPYVCSACKSVNGFRITPMKEIYKILGYVE